ncbi:hypothetical protein GCM10017621_09910 [Maricaulis virginensis]|uniref:Uncharacterized protein n=1 Tax=Maricaulis virginensis TaxID=144022 RepID=A0A9W6IJQ3_9PROT|nr:hypothetical protein GCM10017621_09910 [Maricaulis virginensis]
MPVIVQTEIIRGPFHLETIAAAPVAIDPNGLRHDRDSLVLDGTIAPPTAMASPAGTVFTTSDS